MGRLQEPLMPGDYNPGHDVMSAKYAERGVWESADRLLTQVKRERAMLKASVFMLAVAIILRG